MCRRAPEQPAQPAPRSPPRAAQPSSSRSCHGAAAAVRCACVAAAPAAQGLVPTQLCLQSSCFLQEAAHLPLPPPLLGSSSLLASFPLTQARVFASSCATHTSVTRTPLPLCSKSLWCLCSFFPPSHSPHLLDSFQPLPVRPLGFPSCPRLFSLHWPAVDGAAGCCWCWGATAAGQVLALKSSTSLNGCSCSTWSLSRQPAACSLQLLAAAFCSVANIPAVSFLQGPTTTEILLNPHAQKGMALIKYPCGAPEPIQVPHCYL